MDLAQQIKELQSYDPKAGKGDASACLTSWIKHFTKAHLDSTGISFTPQEVSSILHTLLCAKIRNDRLATERDELSLKIVDLEMNNSK